MMYWNRSATLQIGRHVYSMDNLHFSFDIKIEDSDKLTVATIEAVNLAPSVRNGIQKHDPIIVNAGYDGDVGVLFVGQISGCSHQKSATDITTKITAAIALDKWLGTKVNKTYAPNSKASEIIQDLLRIFGVEVSVLELVEDKSYPRGRVCKGKVKDVLKKIVKECKSRFLLKHGRLIINDPKKALNTGYVLSAATGLLRSEDEVDQIPVDTKKSKKDKKNATITRECMLNYHIGVADQVAIESTSLSGKFKVAAVHHTGSRTGVWKTAIEVKPL